MNIGAKLWVGSLVLGLMVLLVAGCAAPAALPATEAAPPVVQVDVIVPEGTAPTIDGMLSPGEWDGARVEMLSDGSELWLVYNGGYLYLAMRGGTPEMIAGNVFLDRGDEIAVLHASAALGTAIYEQAGGAWVRTQDFAWRCRATDDGPAAVHERQEFLETERWLAANSRRGTPNELEFRIEAAGPAFRLAINLVRSSNPDRKPVWPADLTDDVTRPTTGGYPEQMTFDPEGWVTLGIPRVED